MKREVRLCRPSRFPLIQTQHDDIEITGLGKKKSENSRLENYPNLTCETAVALFSPEAKWLPFDQVEFPLLFQLFLMTGLEGASDFLLMRTHNY